ncbi:aprataxin [Emiliania huxleyi CCMP1516]|uniref:Aprataxin C2HE/C2H2/C2HC zinc finger domain-containing protein n=2 Tax=Emiliania huxleyi TaxID=2903 RepID=A0A0D3JYD5_EMIH1|nr:aprataxin [Emiliania huxleyi CCMP1516]EOD28520.1 aprataxin [Emiliania huxleyi CCMP1516]|eukprot:XP_005780949.1 aprataxin [Emiliania huxleyi CCMP1516]
MQRLARHLAASLRARTPGLPPFLCGFHAAPSLRQLHLHLLSSDLDSDALKNKKHFNSFATSFLFHPASVAAQIESSGKVLSRGHAAEEAALKQDMRCPVTGAPLKNMPAVKAHVARREYAEGVRALAGDADIIERWPGHNRANDVRAR